MFRRDSRYHSLRLIGIALITVGVPVRPFAAPAYHVTMKTAPLLHDPSPRLGQLRSELVVQRGGERRSYFFGMGAKLWGDFSDHGVAVVDTPLEIHGVAVAGGLVLIDLETGAKRTLVEHIVYLITQPRPLIAIGVRNTKPLRAAEMSDRELFVMKFDPLMKSASVTALTRGSWLPSENDLEVLGNEAEAKRLQRQWRRLLRLDKHCLNYRANKKRRFRRYCLDPVRKKR